MVMGYLMSDKCGRDFWLDFWANFTLGCGGEMKYNK